MQYRILVVEDEPGILNFCQVILSSAGFLVDSCSTVAEARQLYNAHRPDFAILDIGLPDGTGTDLIREWHGYPGPKTPVMFLTSRGDLKTRIECFNLGAQDYLPKPFAAEELLARTKVHLQVKKSQEELTKRNYELELLNRARQDMTDMIVHDLKAPVTAIKGTLELIRARGLISQSNYQHLADNAGAAADFMLLMLNDMLDLSRARETGLTIEPANIDVKQLLSKIETLFAARLRAGGNTLTANVAANAANITADQNLIYRIIANLVSNALKATTGANAVEIQCVRKGRKVRITVSDRGRGVPDGKKKSIFNKYTTTGRSEAAVDTGTGIGLSFCNAAVAAHDGRIWVEDRPGGGSRFIVEFPQPATPSLKAPAKR